MRRTDRKRLAPPWVTPPAKGRVIPGGATLLPTAFPAPPKPGGSEAVPLQECGAADLSLAPEHASCPGRFFTKFIVESWWGCGGCLGGTRVCSFLSARRPAVAESGKGMWVRGGGELELRVDVGGGLRAASPGTVSGARPGARSPNPARARPRRPGPQRWFAALAQESAPKEGTRPKEEKAFKAECQGQFSLKLSKGTGARFLPKWLRGGRAEPAPTPPAGAIFSPAGPEPAGRARAERAPRGRTWGPGADSRARVLADSRRSGAQRGRRWPRRRGSGDPRAMDRGPDRKPDQGGCRLPGPCCARGRSRWATGLGSGRQRTPRPGPGRLSVPLAPAPSPLLRAAPGRPLSFSPAFSQFCSAINLRVGFLFRSRGFQGGRLGSHLYSGAAGQPLPIG